MTQIIYYVPLAEASGCILEAKANNDKKYKAQIILSAATPTAKKLMEKRQEPLKLRYN